MAVESEKSFWGISIQIHLSEENMFCEEKSDYRQAQFLQNPLRDVNFLHSFLDYHQTT